MKSFICFWASTLLFCQSIISQDFEGHISYKVTTTVDPKIQQASQELNTPENKEKMKKLEEQMKSPEFQKMLEKNPQLKVQMEAALKLQTSGGLESLTPKSITIFVKDGNSLIKTEGGAQTSQMLHLKEKMSAISSFQSEKYTGSYKTILKTAANNLKPSKPMKHFKS